MESLENVAKPERIHLEVWEEIAGDFVKVVEEEDCIRVRLFIDEDEDEVELIIPEYEGNYGTILEILEGMQDDFPIAIIRTDIPDLEFLIREDL